VAVSVLAVAGSALAPGQATAQEGPYGPTTTGAPSQTPNPTCEVSQSSGEQGHTVGGSITGAPAGDSLDVHLGGPVVAQVVVEPAVGGATTATNFAFTVPSLEPGHHDVVVVGAAFTSTCTVAGASVGIEVTEGPAVAGEVITNQAEVQGSAGAGGLLPFTGSDLLGAVAAALVLMVTGLALRARSRLRSREAPW
jgi:hypothetical protein